MLSDVTSKGNSPGKPGEDNGSSNVYLLGTGIQKSLSPSIHNALFRRLKIDATYSLIGVREAEFEAAILGILQSRDVLGFNITAPFKERVMPYLTKIDAAASAAGAVNTVKIGEGRNVSGYNTDVDGVQVTISELGLLGRSKKKKDSSGLLATILGAGGAARACTFVLLNNGFSSIAIANRSIERAQALAHHFNNQFPRAKLKVVSLKEISKEVAVSDLLINAISDSVKETGKIKVNFSKASDKLRFFDLGYKRESEMLRDARAVGIKSLDGLTMLSEQARKSFEIWTGISPPFELVRSIAKRSLRYI
jgi:shikimate dehydrogenase